MAEQEADTVTRVQKQEGADAIMDKGFVTERDIPEMMAASWSEKLLAAINDELRLRTVSNRAVLQRFHYYMGDGSIIYDPGQLNSEGAKIALQHALGFRK
ncbi:hypothetical protein KTT66_05290 [Lacticaseibacillus casei]|jgi:hypothetical protein|uniref:Uncharacterized protein n=5 Tax=Lacticaseibacillus TaxID=2759736 RepID=A0A5R8LM74_LACZE|nr:MULTISPECIES: hypothetical protein [Lacticaseibacillus]OFR89840.1 hypothetical protein HMPREF2861_01785 [Lactobacillus sp. HMSC068F07]KLI75145.1 hypothetical protein AAW28_10950 [Lacticaseibacillus casei]KRK12653.1 hypothetical protein FD51_GL002533 [Lacticaseibacillus zeae DSM 20178 = KCTC 3804]MDE3281747.1 hypothetical protein [Lacticaseibacillus casei]MDE3314625.1 hypothetical protein [Lacticaseibacillus zeae]